MSRSSHRTAYRSSLRRPGLLAWIHLLRIARRGERAAMQQLREWDLSVAQFDVIAQLGASEGMTQQELGQRLFVTPGNITQLLDKLEARGLLRRYPEGKFKRLELTDAGRTLFDSVVPAHEEWLACQMDVLSPADQRELLRLLGQLDRAQRDA